jgi:toxin ParE1/3/4
VAIRLADLARRDLDEVRAYTVERWGEAQWLRYYRGLVATFERIEADPMTGRARDLFRPGMRSVTYERHVVFFAPIAAAGGAPVVLRILHGRRNLAALAYYEDLDG